MAGGVYAAEWEDGASADPDWEADSSADPDVTEPTESITLDSPLRTDSIQGLFQAIVDIVLVFAIPIIVFFIIYAGFMYVTARGNPEKIQTAHKALLYAIIGGLLIIGANVLMSVISGTVSAIT